MGAHSFDQIGHGATAQDAYRTLCADARHEDGHSGYSGTIATTHGFFLATHNVLPARAAEQMAAGLIGRNDPRLEKWGKCGCIPIAEDKHFALRTVTLTFDATSDLYDHRGTLIAEKMKPAIIAVARKRREIRDGEELLGWYVNKVIPTLRGSVKAGIGKAVTRYVIVERFSDDLRYDLQNVATAFVQGCNSRREAAQTLRTIVKTPPTKFGALQRHFEIIGIICREDGTGVVRGKREVSRQKVTASVSFYTPNPKATATSWLFFGWAAS